MEKNISFIKQDCEVISMSNFVFYFHRKILELMFKNLSSSLKIRNT